MRNLQIDEETRQKRKHYLEWIQQRPAEVLKKNCERILNALNQTYVHEKMNTLHPIHKLTKIQRLIWERKFSEELQKKADTFATFYETSFFPYVAHTSDDLGETIELKSIEKTGTHSGKKDRVIGNTNFVFANTKYYLL